mmetsp:Transcript_8926/g.20049  ORF Transcript_8926/g.20049 Transcript_8926/m.20049 type:complete len:134 (-) Transcript_8926:2952-3353(-)
MGSCTDLESACCDQIPCPRGSFHRRGGSTHCSIGDVRVRIDHCMTCLQDDGIPCEGAVEGIGRGTHHIDVDEAGAAEDNIVSSSRHHNPDHIQGEGRTEEEEDAVQIGAHMHPDEGTEEVEGGVASDCSGSCH